MPRRPKVLFVGEDVTLAHFGRALALAQALDPVLYDVCMASGERYAFFVRQAGVRHVPLWSMNADDFARRVASGRVLHPESVIRRSVADDLRVIRQEQPDLIVGDFRVSMGISAEVAGIPYVAITNAYWSPRTSLRFPLPEHPGIHVVGLGLARLIAAAITPMALRMFLRPFNKVRHSFGQAPVASLYDMFSHGTWTLHPDIPELAPVSALPASHAYIGPVLWEPPVALPSWWHELPTDRPVVYLSIGSSGARAIFGAAMAALGDEDVTVVASYADREVQQSLPKNFYVAPYLPGTACASRSDVVVCNGGSGTIYQALSAGVPLVGIPANSDQHLAMHEVVRRGAGLQVRSDQVTGKNLRQATRRVLRESEFARSATELAVSIGRYDAKRTFAARVAALQTTGQQEVA